MKRSTAALRKQVAEAEADDEKLIAELSGILASLQVLKDDAEQRRELFLSAVNEFYDTHRGEIDALEQKFRGIIARQRGEPIAVVIEGGKSGVPAKRQAAE